MLSKKKKNNNVLVLCLDLLPIFQSVNLLLTHRFVSYLVLFPGVLRLGLLRILHHCIRKQKHLLEVSSAPLPIMPTIAKKYIKIKIKKTFYKNSFGIDIRSQSIDALLQTDVAFPPKAMTLIWLCVIGQVLCGRRRIRQVAVPQWRTLFLRQHLTCSLLLTTAQAEASETSDLTPQASCSRWRLPSCAPRILTKQ